MRVWLDSKWPRQRGVSVMAVIKIVITNIILFKLQRIHRKVFVDSLEDSELCHSSIKSTVWFRTLI